MGLLISIDEIRTLPSGTSVTDINTALGVYNIIYLEPGDYAVGASETITIPDGKQLLGMFPGVSQAEDNPGATYVRLLGTTARSIPLVIMSGGGKFAHCTVEQQELMTTRGMVEANVDSSNVNNALTANRRCFVDDLHIKYNHTVIGTGTGLHFSGRATNIIVRAENFRLDRGIRFAGLAINGATESEDYTVAEGCWVSGCATNYILGANKTSLLNSTTIDSEVGGVSIDANNCTVRAIYVDEPTSTFPFTVSASKTDTILSDITFTSGTAGDLNLGSSTTGVFHSLRREGSNIIPTVFFAIATSDAWHTNEVTVIEYTGNSAIRTITCGFTPRFIIINRETGFGTNEFAVFNFGAANTHIVGVAANRTNAITGVVASGFTLGTDGSVNSTGNLHRAIVFK